MISQLFVGILEHRDRRFRKMPEIGHDSPE